MDQHTNSPLEQNTRGRQDLFEPGTQVIYSMHGRCNVVSIETRKLGAETIKFYKLEVQKSALSRSSRQEPAIWVPVSSAKDQGLRTPLQNNEVEKIYSAINSREYYFQAQEPWSTILPKLESSIRLEGALGLAKVLSYLHVLKRKQVVPSTEVTRLYENVGKLLLRELSEASGETIRKVEEKVSKGLRHKLVPDA